MLDQSAIQRFSNLFRKKYKMSYMTKVFNRELITAADHPVGVRNSYHVGLAIENYLSILHPPEWFEHHSVKIRGENYIIIYLYESTFGTWTREHKSEPRSWKWLM